MEVHRIGNIVTVRKDGKLVQHHKCLNANEAKKLTIKLTKKYEEETWNF